MKNEILIIAKYEKTLDFLLKDIADKLRDNGIHVKLDRKNTSLETDKIIIIGKSPSSTCIGRSWSRLKYYMIYEYFEAWITDEEMNNLNFRLPECAKKLHEVDEIIEIVRELNMTEIGKEIQSKAEVIAELLKQDKHVELCENKDGLRIIAMDRKVVK